MIPSRSVHRVLRRLAWLVPWSTAILAGAKDRKVEPASTEDFESVTGKGVQGVIDGERVLPTMDGQKMGEFKEFPVPAKCLKDRKLVLTWDIPNDEGHLNWRQRSRLSEVWLIKR